MFYPEQRNMIDVIFSPGIWARVFGNLEMNVLLFLHNKTLSTSAS